MKTTSLFVGAWVLAAVLCAASDAQSQSASLESGIADNHYGVQEALQLDHATFDELIKLLAAQLREQSEYVQAMFDGKLKQPDPMDRMRDEAKRVTQQVDALRALLGQEKLERYQKLRFSLGQRRQIRQLDERLGPSDQLSVTQREQLVELWNDHFISAMEQRHMLSIDRFPLGGEMRAFQSREEMERDSRLRTIALNEQGWREMPESNRRLRERAAEFLTQRQLEVLAQLHAEQLATLQQQIEQMRMQMDLSRTIPETAEVTEVPAAIVMRDVKISLEVAVNDESPRYLTTTVSGGKSVSLKIGSNLFLEATPIVFANDAYNLRVRYYEAGVTGKRLIGNSGLGGMVTQASTEGRSRPRGGGSGSVLTGSKGYVVELSALVEAT